MIREYNFSPNVLGEEFDLIEMISKRKLTMTNTSKTYGWTQMDMIARR